MLSFFSCEFYQIVSLKKLIDLFYLDDQICEYIYTVSLLSFVYMCVHMWYICVFTCVHVYT